MVASICSDDSRDYPILDIFGYIPHLEPSDRTATHSLEPCAVCDVLNFNYYLPFRPLDKSGRSTPEAVEKFSWERTFPLPTPGVMVKGWLDTCAVCEKELQKKIELELVHQELENQLLKKQIDLLEKSGVALPRGIRKSLSLLKSFPRKGNGKTHTTCGLAI